MERTSTRSPVPHLLFAGIVIAVYVAGLALADLLPALERPGAVAAGIAVDLVVVVPIAFYVLLVRRRRLPVAALVPVVVLSFVAAARVLPADHQRPLRILEMLAVPIEIGLLGWIAWRATRALGRARRDQAAEPLERFHSAALEMVRHARAAAVFATEIAVFYYAGAWRARPHAPAGASAFTHHRRAGHAGIVLGLVLLIAVEGIAVHFFLARWSAPVAWIFTIGSAYTVLWMLADYRATALRPILVEEDWVYFRAGLRWTVRAPREPGIRVLREKPESGKECLNLTFLGVPTHWIVLPEPVPAIGPYGFRRRVRAVGIEPDDAAALERALDCRSG